ncbi:hypothetical protein [Suttonella ornithocola]|uniref:Fe(III)-pyochelin receptor n=1 Tax=Suttonella ornithocola TaxID=279832 RepID=A0A380MLT9_9GAMM|nr:hypothetical protein [Suttonella ornithocola]SUO93208.1 Fe(III)-pyochelin receptor [Suttonella ornithocola]
MTIKGDVSGAFNQSQTIRVRVLAESFHKENPNAKKSNHHETLYGALDIDLTPQTTLGLGYLYQQRHIHPDNGLPLQGKTLISLPNKQYYGANWNRFNSKSHDLFADVKHEFTNGAVGQVSARFSKRDIDWNYAFPSSAIDKAQTFTAIGTARNIQQKAFTFDANYSRPFSTLDNVSEFVIGADYKTFHAEAKNARLPLAKGERLTVSELNHLPNIDLLIVKSFIIQSIQSRYKERLI